MSWVPGLIASWSLCLGGCADQSYKLKELEEFTRQKDSLQAQLETERQSRADDERKWREERAASERHFVQEKDRWQKELQHQIKETKVRSFV